MLTCWITKKFNLQKINRTDDNNIKIFFHTEKTLDDIIKLTKGTIDKFKQNINPENFQVKEEKWLYKNVARYVYSLTYQITIPQTKVSKNNSYYSLKF